MKILDLFSGIGGFSLGLERAGMTTVAFCEIDPYCQAVLRKHWPDVAVFGDVRKVTVATLADALGQGKLQSYWGVSEIGKRSCYCGVDLVCGGFPCQDISVAGKGAGLAGARSGLWSEFARIIGAVRPKYAIVENVAALLHRGLGDVLGDLASLGYDAEWHCIPACAVGAPHRRDRIWIVAYPGGTRRQQITGSTHGDESAHEGRATQYNHEPQCDGESYRKEIQRLNREIERADKELTELRGYGFSGVRGQLPKNVAHPERTRLQGFSRQAGADKWWASGFAASLSEGLGGEWQPEPDVGRVAHGVPSRVHRLRGLGNAVVPQIAEIIGRAIMSIEATREPATWQNNL